MHCLTPEDPSTSICSTFASPVFCGALLNHQLILLNLNLTWLSNEVTGFGRSKLIGFGLSRFRFGAFVGPLGLKSVYARSISRLQVDSTFVVGNSITLALSLFLDPRVNISSLPLPTHARANLLKEVSNRLTYCRVRYHVAPPPKKWNPVKPEA